MYNSIFPRVFLFQFCDIHFANPNKIKSHSCIVFLEQCVQFIFLLVTQSAVSRSISLPMSNSPVVLLELKTPLYRGHPKCSFFQHRIIMPVNSFQSTKLLYSSIVLLKHWVQCICYLSLKLQFPRSIYPPMSNSHIVLKELQIPLVLGRPKGTFSK